MPTGPNKTADYFGSLDYWLIKIRADGSTAWQRSYGGAGSENPVSIVQTDDGGFLVSGESYNSGISGNKTVDGDGIWLLKLDSRGLKEAEVLIPPDAAFSGPSFMSLLKSADGYRVVGSDWVMNLNSRRKIVVNARSTGRPFNLDISSDLATWRTVVSGFNGSLMLTEDWSTTNRFYRTVEEQ